MTFTTKWGKHREYFGMTELRGMQSQDAACDIRLENHLGRPLECMATAVVSTFQIEHQGRPMTKRNCLAQEAIFAAEALGRDATARGACFSCKKLGPFLQKLARQVRKVVRALGGQAARDAVLQYAAGLDEGHPLCRHLAGEPYKMTTISKAQLPDAVQSSRSGKSGKSGHLTRKKQLDEEEYARGDSQHRRLKRGLDPSGTRRAENDRRSIGRSGLRKRPAAQR
jgi:hypothetical protein